MADNNINIKTVNSSSSSKKKTIIIILAVLLLAAAALVLYIKQKPVTKPVSETVDEQEELKPQTDYRHLILQQAKVIVPRTTESKTITLEQLPKEVAALATKDVNILHVESLSFYNDKTGYRVLAQTNFSGLDKATQELRAAYAQNKALKLLGGGYNDGAGLLEYQSDKWEIQIILTNSSSEAGQDYVLTVVRR